jgi:hypothetical protein
MTSSHLGSSSIIPSGLAAADAESVSSNAAQSSWPDDRAFNSSTRSGEVGRWARKDAGRNATSSAWARGRAGAHRP